MDSNIYELENYRGIPKYNLCPKCGQNTFQKYRLMLTDEPGLSEIGKCSCGYDKQPTLWVPVPSFIPEDVFSRSLSDYNSNTLCLQIKKRFGIDQMNKAIGDYSIGTGSLTANPGAAVLWRITREGKVCTGRISTFDTNTSEEKTIGWVHKRIANAKRFNLQPCLFGEHLLNDKTKTVVIVEDEKTAIISSCRFPEYLWLSAGDGRKGLFGSYRDTLSDRKVICKPETWHRLENHVPTYNRLY